MMFQTNLRCFALAFMVIVSIAKNHAQAPQIINYQAVVRDAAGEVVKNKAINFRLSILDGSVTGTPQYIETQSKTTNQFGLVTFGIGQGTTVSGGMNAVTWANLTKFLKVELDINGGNNFSLMSTSQFLSVPFALYAATSGSGGASSQWLNNNVGINYNAGNVGLGTSIPSTQLHTTGGVRFQGLSQNNTLNNVLASDASGNLAWRDASTLVNIGGWLLSGNAVGANNFLGTTNLQNLRFYTNNTQKAVLTTDGKLGIGSTNPPSKLSVEVNSDGFSEIDDRLMVDIRNISTSAASQAIMRITAGTGGNFTNLGHSSSTYSIGPDTDAGILWSTGTGGLILRASPKSSSDPDVNAIRFYTGWNPNSLNATSERMRLDKSGNLGIGTTIPSTQLHTTGGVRFQGLSQNNTLSKVMVLDLNNNVSWRDASTLISTVGSSWSLTGNATGANDFVGTTNAQNLRLFTNNTQKAVLTTEGNLGVGTSNPISKLSIETNSDGIFSSGPDGRIVVDIKNTSTSYAAQTIMQLSGGSSNNFTRFSYTPSNYTVTPDSDSGQMWASGTGGLILRASPKNNTDPDLGGIRFLTGWFPNSTGSLERMKIESNGNVGIGTSTPKAKVEVANGDVYLTDPTKGIILKSPNGNCWRVTVDNTGNLVRTQITCPQ